MSSTLSFTSPAGSTVSVPNGIFINNKFHKSVKGETFESFNPSTGEVLAAVERGSEKDLDLAVAAAREAFDTTWGRHSTPGDRAAKLFKFADLIDAHAPELAVLEALDGGKPRWIAETMDIADAAGCFRYYAGLADKVSGRTIEINEQERWAYTKIEPIGVCGAIIPWNYPIGMLSWKLAPALAAGNSVILKPAEQTPISALKIAELSVEAGFPPGVLSVVNGFGADLGSAISSHPGIDKVAFTGSTVTGRKVMESAAKSNLKKITLELGGKSPVMVFNDVDLDETVPWVALALIYNMGQDCTAGTRLFVQSGIYDEFLKRLLKALSEHGIGDVFNDDTFQGPQISKTQQQKILQYIEYGKQEAKLELGGGVWPGAKGTKFENGYWVSPTVFSGCKAGMKIVDDEIFGPVLAVAKFDTEDEAVAYGNNTTYGLGAGVFARDVGTIMRVTGAIQAGTVWVNNYAILSNGVPFGGYKASGYGRELGLEGIKEYTQTKAVHLNFGEKFPWPPTLSRM